jgi:hypothetical protein
MATVAINGVTDPNDGGVVTITPTGITQDEPTNGPGDGDTSPDARILGEKVLLRAERSGTGNGRVYRINFTASDQFSQSCSGSATVSVPLDKNGSRAVDDGQKYNSLQ